MLLKANVRRKLVEGNQCAGLSECRVSLFDQWRVTVPKGERVCLTFTSFDLVPEVCGDFVQVFDGYTAGSSSLGKHGISDTLPVCREEHERNHEDFKMGRDTAPHPVTQDVIRMWFHLGQCNIHRKSGARFNLAILPFLFPKVNSVAGRRRTQWSPVATRWWSASNRTTG